MAPSRSILYVDDEDSNLTVFEAAFEDHFDVHLASGGDEALALLERTPIQVVVTDMRMPKMGGVELLERIIERWPHIIRIILTGYTDIASVIQAINQGHVYQYVTKPWDERDVGQLLSRALHRHDADDRERRLRAELDAIARREELVRSMFQRYVPAEVVERVFDANPAPREGGARSHEVVLIFADLRSFTPLCSKLDAATVLGLMNEYFSLMTDIIDARGGLVSTFLGDAIVALFPSTAAEDEELRAVGASVEMAAALERFNEERARAIWPPGLAFGVGIQRGRVTTGEIGSADARTFAVIGDAFYQVKQVEERCKGHPNAIVVTAEVAARLGDAFELSPHGTLAWSQGDQVSLFRVLGARGGRSA